MAEYVLGVSYKSPKRTTQENQNYVFFDHGLLRIIARSYNGICSFEDPLTPSFSFREEASLESFKGELKTNLRLSHLHYHQLFPAVKRPSQKKPLRPAA